MTAKADKLRRKLELAEAEEEVIEAARLFFCEVDRMTLDQFLKRRDCFDYRRMEGALERLDRLREDRHD